MEHRALQREREREKEEISCLVMDYYKNVGKLLKNILFDKRSRKSAFTCNEYNIATENVCPNCNIF